jgi:(p)ppGpp synthase/HD superfamily hydrolase
LASNVHGNIRINRFISAFPQGAAEILKRYRLGTTSIVAALLHDVVEDTDTTIDDIDRLFGNKVARIIDGLTKISEIFDYGTASTIVYPVKATYPVKTFYRRATEVNEGWIRILNFYVNAFGELMNQF